LTTAIKANTTKPKTTVQEIYYKIKGYTDKRCISEETNKKKHSEIYMNPT
jgi:hypothetical protein